MQVALLGAGGTVGRVIGRLLEARGIAWVGVGRDAPRGPSGAGLLVSAAGGDLPATRQVVAAAVQNGTDVIDVDHETGYARWLAALAAREGVGTGARVVPAAGLRWAIGDLLSALAAAPVPAPAAVHVAYTSGGSRRHLTPGERRAAIAALEAAGSALEAEERARLGTGALGAGRLLLLVGGLALLALSSCHRPPAPSTWRRS